MSSSEDIREEQERLWNGPAGRAWVEAQAVVERLFRPFEELLASAVPEGSAARVLDVGCGTGALTQAVARRLAAPGHSTGIDLSAPMIEAARRTSGAGAPAAFIRADAQRHAFRPGYFDHLVSRFGVMFFDQPAQAFANLRAAARPGATLEFVAWRSPAENPFMTTAEAAAAPLLPALPPRHAGGPGQFAFADAGRVRRILDESGWREAALQPLDVDCRMPEADLLHYLSWLGPVGQALQRSDAQTRARVLAVLRQAFQPYVRDGEVRFTAACWRVSATAP